jgi:hypothetical protein
MLLLVALAAEAADLRLTQLDALRYEPVGMESQNTALVRWPFFPDRKSVLLEDCGLGVGLSARANPAFPSVGPAFEVMPLAVLIARGGVDLTWFDGGFGYMQSWPEVGDPALYDEPNRRATSGNAYPTTATRTWGELTIQAMVWRIAARTMPGVELWKVDLTAGDEFFYLGSVDTFVQDDGIVLTDHTDVLYVDGPYVAGLRWSGVWPRLDPSPVKDVSHTRLGPLLAWTPDHRDGTAEFTFFAVAGWYLKHPNRGGPVPYTAAGVTWVWDVPLGSPP